MIITKEQQEAMLSNYIKRNNVEDNVEINAFIDGMNAMYDLINRLMEQEKANK